MRSFRSLVQERANDRTAAFVALYTLNAGVPLGKKKGDVALLRVNEVL